MLDENNVASVSVYYARPIRFASVLGASALISSIAHIRFSRVCLITGCISLTVAVLYLCTKAIRIKHKYGSVHNIIPDKYTLKELLPLRIVHWVIMLCCIYGWYVSHYDANLNYYMYEGLDILFPYSADSSEDLSWVSDAAYSFSYSMPNSTELALGTIGHTLYEISILVQDMSAAKDMCEVDRAVIEEQVQLLSNKTENLESYFTETEILVILCALDSIICKLFDILILHRNRHKLANMNVS